MSALSTAAASSALVALLLLGAAILTWVERRLLGFFQERRGPNRAGPAGTLQWVADLVKILTKEDSVPTGSDAALFRLAPALAAAPLLAGFGAIAFAPGWIVAPTHAGLLFVLGTMALTAYAIVLGAVAQSSRYAVMGGLRAAAQLLAYEVFLGLSLMGVVMLAGSFELPQIVAAQSGAWFILTQPVGALVFLVAGVAAAHRLPFDHPEAENDLVGGYVTGYSGMGFGLFFLGEYLAVLLVSALFATLFLGGWLGPLLPGPVWFALKTGAVVFVFLLLRAALPRPRYDQLVAFGWTILLPAALLNLLLTGLVVVARG